MPLGLSALTVVAARFLLGRPVFGAVGLVGLVRRLLAVTRRQPDFQRAEFVPLFFGPVAVRNGLQLPQTLLLVYLVFAQCGLLKVAVWKCFPARAGRCLYVIPRGDCGG